MKKDKTILGYYTKLAAAIAVSIDEDNHLFITDGDVSIPVKALDLPLVLPTVQLLQLNDWSTHTPFHPLSEALGRGESDVLKRVIKIGNAYLSDVLRVILLNLFQLSADTDMHASLNSRQTKLIMALPEVKSGMCAKMKKICDAFSYQGPNKGIGIYIARKVNLKGRSYSRVGVINSRLNAQDWEGTGTRIFGVTVSKKEYEAIMALVEYVIPALHTGVFNHGSNSTTAPNLLSYFGAYANIGKHLNKIINTFKSILPDLAEWSIDLGYTEYDDVIDELAIQIGALESNKGTVEAMTTAPVDAAVPHESYTRTIQAAESEIAPQQAVAAVPADDPVSAEDGVEFVRRTPAYMIPNPNAVQQPVYQPVQQQAPAYYMPQQAPMQQAPAYYMPQQAPMQQAPMPQQQIVEQPYYMPQQAPMQMPQQQQVQYYPQQPPQPANGNMRQRVAATSNVVYPVQQVQQPGRFPVY